MNAKIEILNVTDKNITRAHELVQRTNRLNFTNHRYTQEEINNFLETKDRFVCRLISVKDRFGDYGVVGFFILEKTNEKEWFIKDLMFSCRIQGRHIDIFVLQKILENAQRHNIKKVKGILSLSTKNANAKEVYLSANFRQTQEEGGILSFEFNFEHQQVLTNDYITTVGDSNF